MSLACAVTSSCCTARAPSQLVRADVAPQHAVRSESIANSGCCSVAETWTCQPVAVRSSLNPLGYRHGTQMQTRKGCWPAQGTSVRHVCCRDRTWTVVRTIIACLGN